MPPTEVHAPTDDRPDGVEATVRSRLRSLRQAHGWSLDTLAERAHLSASTISRIETGKRTISLDVLLPLARALQVGVEALIEADGDDADVVIRPVAAEWHDATVWPLSRPTGTTAAYKMRLTPPAEPGTPKVHPGHDWFFVLSGRIRLTLGERIVVVETGEAAEFSTMTPHAIEALDGPAEILTVFDHAGQRAHVHSES